MIIELQDIPMPPSVNSLYSYNPKIRRRFKIKSHPFFSDFNAWCIKNYKFKRDAFELNDKELVVERFFCTPYDKIYTKKGTRKVKDVTNLVKALDDSVFEFLSLDDKWIRAEASMFVVSDKESVHYHIREFKDQKISQRQAQARGLINF